MKKIISVLSALLIMVLLMVSCESASQEDAQEYADKTFREIEYKGHSYILFFHCEGYSGFAGLEHNPDCLLNDIKIISNENKTDNQ